MGGTYQDGWAVSSGMGGLWSWRGRVIGRDWGGIIARLETDMRQDARDHVFLFDDGDQLHLPATTRARAGSLA